MRVDSSSASAALAVSFAMGSLSAARFCVYGVRMDAASVIVCDHGLVPFLLDPDVSQVTLS